MNDIRSVVEKMMDSSLYARDSDLLSISNALGLKSRGMDLIFKNNAHNKFNQEYITEHDMCILVDRLSQVGVNLQGLLPKKQQLLLLPDQKQNQEDPHICKLSKLLLKEYDTTHSGSLSQLEFSGLMMQIQNEIQAHQQFVGTELHQVGSYITGRTLGFGKTGIVKCAVSRSGIGKKSCEQICLKISQAASNKCVAAKKLFAVAQGYCTPICECEALKMCQFEGVVRFIESFTHIDIAKQGWQVIALELCGGGSLHEYSISTQVTEPIARFYMTQLFIALEKVHVDAKIAHLDIRLENIMIDNEGNAKLADFGTAMQFSAHQVELQQAEQPNSPNSRMFKENGKGVPLVTESICQRKQCGARLCDDLLKPGTHAGAISHMPPEMLTLKTPFSAMAVDMWQCGLVMYQLLTSRRAFDLAGHTPGDVIQAIQQCAYEPLDFNFSAEARNLCMQLLSPDFLERPTVTEVLDHPWL